ncbi:MAG: PQQ-binding-like beta-propeller repeat protein, partial [Thermoguttaceae bacterium]
RLDGGMLLGLDRKTGQEVWRSLQPGHDTFGFWSSPVACTIDGTACVVWLSCLSVVGIAPNDGKTLWRYELAPPEYPLGRDDHRGTVATTPIVVGNRIFAQYHPPYMRGFSYCLEVSGGKPKVLYKLPDLAAWYHSCIFYDGCVYGVDQPIGKPSEGVGILQCYDLQSGRMQWSTDTFDVESDAGEPTRLKASDTFMIANGKMISWGRELVVAEVNSRGYKVLAVADLGHSAHWTVPVLCDGKIYCRTSRGKLLCLDVRKP